MKKIWFVQALLMAVYQRRSKQQILVHSDQGRQYGISGYQSFVKEHNLQAAVAHLNWPPSQRIRSGFTKK